MSPADFPASNCRARPKSAMQEVRLVFSSRFLLLMSLEDTNKQAKCRQSNRADTFRGSDAWEERVGSQMFQQPTCERWTACVRPCVPGCLHGGRPGRGLQSERCGRARSTTPRWPSGSLSASPEETTHRQIKTLAINWITSYLARVSGDYQPNGIFYLLGLY